MDAYPGLRCACPGLVSILPPGEKGRRFHLPVARQGRWTTDTELEFFSGLYSSAPSMPQLLDKLNKGIFK